jgi:hypothetical protein
MTKTDAVHHWAGAQNSQSPIDAIMGPPGDGGDLGTSAVSGAVQFCSFLKKVNELGDSVARGLVRLLALKTPGNFQICERSSAHKSLKYTFEQFSGTNSPFASSFVVLRATGEINV